MVVLGGVTRLTRSGLSMTDWKFTGEKPPRTQVQGLRISLHASCSWQFTCFLQRRSHRADLRWYRSAISGATASLWRKRERSVGFQLLAASGSVRLDLH